MKKLDQFKKFQKLIIWLMIALIVFPATYLQDINLNKALASTTSTAASHDIFIKGNNVTQNATTDEQNNPIYSEDDGGKILDDVFLNYLLQLSVNGSLPGEIVDIKKKSDELFNLMFSEASLEKIVFKNPLDEFAIFGEPCTPHDQSRWLCTQEEGDDFIQNGAEAGKSADIFANNRWDGPVYDPIDQKIYSIVDSRVLEMLRYLTTPSWKGGAGREKIVVSRIVQFFEKDQEVKEVMAENEEPDKQDSAHYIGDIVDGRRLIDNPQTPIQAMDISEIDNVRISTKVTKKRRVGGSKTSYKYQRPFGVKVAWQSDKGIQKAGVPAVDVMTGAEDMFKAGLIDLLADFEVTDALVPSDLSDVDIQSIASFIGSEMLRNVLDSPKGSLGGFDIGDTMEKLARYIIADEFGLPREAFVQGNTADDFERNVGQYELEERFGLPHGAFDGQYSNELVKNAGRRWLEEEVFNVAKGTLDYDSNAVPAGQRQNYLLERLGSGRIASVFNFEPTDAWFQSRTWADMEKTNKLRFGFIFNDKNKEQFNYIDDYLGIETMRNASNPAADANTEFNNPDNLTPKSTDPTVFVDSKTFIENGKSDPNIVQRYKNTVGRYAFMSALGTLNRQTSNTDDLRKLVQGAGSDPAFGPSNYLGTLNIGEINPETSQQDAIPSLYISIIDKLNRDKGLDDKPLSSEAVAYRQSFLPDTEFDKLKRSGIYKDANYYRHGPLDTIYIDNSDQLTKSFPTDNEIKAAVDDIKRALLGDPSDSDSSNDGGVVQLINNACQLAHKGVAGVGYPADVVEPIDMSDPSKINPDRLKIVQALDALKEKTYMYVDAVTQAQQQLEKTPADEALGLNISPELLRTLQDPNSTGAAGLKSSLSVFNDVGGVNSSIIKKLQGGDLSIIPAIGLIKISQKTSESTREQATVQVNLFENTQSFFDRLASLGLSEDHVNGRFGLIDGDYDRLFLKDMAPSVFERIGQAEILAAIWKHPAFQEEVQRVKNHEEYQSIEQYAAEATQKLNFFVDRMTTLTNLSETIYGQINDLPDDIEANVSTQWGRVRGIFNNGQLNTNQFKSISTVKQFIKNFEKDQSLAYDAVKVKREELINSAKQSNQDTNSAVSSFNNIFTNLNQFDHTVQEILAGKALVYEQRDNVVDPVNLKLDLDLNDKDDMGVYVSEKKGKCWNAGQILGLFMQGTKEIESNATTFLKQVGGCELDNRFYLPIGSIYGFYQASPHDSDNFFYSVGKASFVNQTKAIPSDRAAVSAIGKKIVIHQAVAKLATQSGLFKNISAKYSITEYDIFEMVTGHFDKVATRVGGRLIDQRLNLTPGSAAELINPCQTDDALKNGRDCKQPGQRDEIRTHILAREGFRRLGIEMDLPMGVDLVHGNFRDNLGLAKMERALSIKFKFADYTEAKTLDDLVTINGLDNVLSGFGIPSTPFMTLLNSLYLETEAAREAIAAKPVFTSQELADLGRYKTAMDNLEQLLQTEKLSLWDKMQHGEQVSGATRDYIYWWDQTALRAIRQDPNDPLITAEATKPAGISDAIKANLAPNAKRVLTDILNKTVGEYKQELANQFANNAFLFSSRWQRIDNNLNIGSSYTTLPALSSDTNVVKDGMEASYPAWSEHDTQSSTVGISAYQGQTFKADSQKGQTIPAANEVPSIRGVIKGQMSITDLINRFGKIALWTMGVDLVGQKFPDTFIGKALSNYDQFRQAVGGNVPSIEEVFSGEYAKNNGGDAFWDDLFFGNSQTSAQARGFIFDKFLASSFTADLEDKAGVSSGALKSVFMYPNLSRQIAIDEGMAKIGTQLFRYGNDDSRDQRWLKYSLNRVYKAGFMADCSDKVLLDRNVKVTDMCIARQGKNYFTYDFNTDRAISEFQTLVDYKIRGETQKALGVPLPLSDVMAIAHGDVNTMAYVAAAFTITQANTKDKDSRGNRNYFPQERLVDYAVARRATIGDPDGASVIAAGQFSASYYETDFVNTYCTVGDDPVACVNTVPADQQKEYFLGVEAARRQGEKEENNRVRKAGQSEFQYAMTDIALYRVDPRVPKGFSSMMLGINPSCSKTRQATKESCQNNALLAYGFNVIFDNHPKNDHSSDGDQINAVRNIFFKNTDSILAVDDFLAAIDGLNASGQQLITNIVSNKQLFDLLNFEFKTVVQEAFDLNLSDDLAKNVFGGLMAWADTGKLDGSINVGFDYNGDNKVDGNDKLTSLQDTAEDWASNRIFRWADSHIGFDAGTSKLLYDNSKAFFASFKDYTYIRSHGVEQIDAKFGGATGKYSGKTNAEIQKSVKDSFRKATAEFVTFAVTTIFKSQIAKAEQKLGLVPGTGAMLVGMLVNLAVGVPVDPITIALFIGLNLFGYYKVVVQARGTADGYYPYRGSYGSYTVGGVEILATDVRATDGTTSLMTSSKTSYYQYPSADLPLGEFDARDDKLYKSALKEAAKTKVEGLLTDMATAPERWSAATGTDMYVLMPSQIFTMLPEHIDNLNGYISRPPCRSQQNIVDNGGCGYGLPQDRDRSGFFANSDPDDNSFWDHIHVAW